MKTAQIYIAILVASLVLVSGPVARAMDTDVYLKAKDLGGDEAPNVMIILDTSGSMSDPVQSPPDYDPNIDYCTGDLDTLTGYSGANAGKPSGCAGIANRIYWSFTSSAPSMTSNQWFTPSKNKCIDSNSALNSAGFYGSTRIARWRSGANWNTLNGETDGTITYVDCRADGNNDGLADNDSQRPRNSSATAYTTLSSQGFSWSGYSGSNTTPTLYTSNYMNFAHNSLLPTIPTVTRLDAAKSAVKAIIDANTTMRFGLMVFNANNTSGGQNGGRVVYKIDTMDAARRTAMKNVVDNTSPGGRTPLAETLWESYRYFSGLTVQYGDDDLSNTPVRDLTAEVGGTTSAGGTYISPFAFSCQTAYIIYVTDGDPTTDSAADNSIRTLAGLSSGACYHDDNDPEKSCLKDLAGYMHNQDILTTLPESQTVTLHTVGFGTGISPAGEALLKNAATMGGGEYKTATNATELANAIQGALSKALEKPTSVTAPSLSVNAFNRLYNREDIYLALFKPSNSCAWPGNIKKYRLCNQADIAAGRCDSLNDIIDQNNTQATDDDGFLLDTARSKWSSDSDGAEVTAGSVGIALAAPASRVIYTHPGSYTGLSSSSPATPVSLEVPASGSNSFYTYVTADVTRLGLPSSAANPADVDTLIGWIRGTDAYNKWTYNSSPTTDPRAPTYLEEPTTGANNATDNTRRWAFGDVLHSRPVAITYGGTSASPIIKLFVGTNDGMVHMLRNDTGEVQWSFMPKEMYSVQYKLAQAADGDHPHGMDNTPTFWNIDNNKDGIIDPSAGDKLYMYISMRRGGRNVYAFDITPAASMTSNSSTFTPKLMWVIEGGAGDYTLLGETWSRPLVARVRVKCPAGGSCDDGDSTTADSTTKVVLLFGGGYDTNKDYDVNSGVDSKGNALFMADPLTGTRLWWASKASSGSGAYTSLPKMNFGIPSDLAMLDTDGDGATDRLYVGDTGGQLWRIDLGSQLDPGIASGGTSGYVFADVGCATEAENSSTIGTAYPHDNTSGACPSGVTTQGSRRFFYPPDVAPITDNTFSTSPNYDMVTIGSGNREDPLDFLTDEVASGSKEAIHNRVYAFRDYNYVTGAPQTTPSTPLTEADLYDATANLLGTLTGAALTAQITTIKAKKGWYVDLKETSDIAMPNGITTHWVGEKVLATPTIEDGVVKITSFTPANSVNSAAAVSAGACNAAEGVAKLYGFNILNAAAAVDFDGDGDADRSVELGGGIPSEVVRIFLPDGNTSLVQAGGGLHSGGPDDPTGGLKRNSWQGCAGSPGSDTSLCGE